MTDINGAAQALAADRAMAEHELRRAYAVAHEIFQSVREAARVAAGSRAAADRTAYVKAMAGAVVTPKEMEVLDRATSRAHRRAALSGVAHDRQTHETIREAGRVWSRARAAVRKDLVAAEREAERALRRAQADALAAYRAHPTDAEIVFAHASASAGLATALPRRG